MAKSSRSPTCIAVQCPNCSDYVEFDLPKGDEPVSFDVDCFVCKKPFPMDVSDAREVPSGGASASSPPKTKRKDGRKKGTAEEPLETEYYEWLEVAPSATQAEIKKKYYFSLPEAEEKFKQISEAYQVLSDPKLRSQYNELGAEKNREDNAMVDPMSFFNQLFGGERFVSMIGELNIISELTQVAEEAMEEEDGATSPTSGKAIEASTAALTDAEREQHKQEKKRKKEELAKKRQETDERNRLRIIELSNNLRQKLAIYVENTDADPAAALAAWEAQIKAEAEDLKTESLGVELLHTIGGIYRFQAKKYLEKQEFLGGFRGVYQSFKETGQIMSGAYSTIRAALDLQRTYAELAKAEENNISPEEKQRLEEHAAKKALEALWKSGRLEIENILRETCNIVLHDKQVDKKTIRRRAIALKAMGDIYAHVTPDPDQAPNPFMPMDSTL
ncbi:DnaJ-like protein [Coemansia sp. Benny D115]|nr:DnaJ-like protein [Coemansia sp. Benny D115]